MPCHARLDAPGILHHVMVRGIEGRVIFRDKVDRAAFVAALRHTLPPAPGDRGAAPTVAAIIQRVCTSLGMDPMRLQRGGHKPAVPGTGGYCLPGYRGGGASGAGARAPPRGPPRLRLCRGPAGPGQAGALGCAHGPRVDEQCNPHHIHWRQLNIQSRGPWYQPIPLWDLTRRGSSDNNASNFSLPAARLWCYMFRAAINAGFSHVGLGCAFDASVRRCVALAEAVHGFDPLRDPASPFRPFARPL